MNLKDFQNNFAKGLFGITIDQAHKDGICIDCKRKIDVKTLEEIDRREYLISGLCPKCYDRAIGKV